MRIVAGTHGGRVLRAPAGGDTRPTSEKVRQALFNILGDVEGVHILDLFAGSGAMGLEALSRGAAHATFVDSARPALDAVKGNLADLGLTARATVLPGDALKVAARPPPAAWKIVFIDPPYRTDLATRAAIALPRASLAEGATVVIEHDRRNAPLEQLGFLVRTDERHYGDTVVSFYQ